MSPRIFVSSVIDGFEDYRNAARSAIARAGGTPVLAEDSPASPTSPRNACLDLVSSCDAVVCIVATRGGYRAPSGKLVVEEEFDEARSKGIPTLLLVDERPKDADAEALVDQLSPWVRGLFRGSFGSVRELGEGIYSALIPIMDRLQRPGQDPRVIDPYFPVPHAASTSWHTTLRVVIAPAIQADLIDELAIDGLEMQIQRFAHETNFFEYEFSKRTNSGNRKLSIAQDSGGENAAEIEINCSGLMAASKSIARGRQRATESAPLSAMFEIVKSDLIQLCGEELATVVAIADLADPHERFPQWLIQAGLLNPGHKKIVDTAAESNTVQTGLAEVDLVTAFDAPLSVTRAALGHPDIQERIAGLLQRRLRSSSSL